jgi:hypothetical protein
MHRTILNFYLIDIIISEMSVPVSQSLLKCHVRKSSFFKAANPDKIKDFKTIKLKMNFIRFNEKLKKKDSIFK